MTFKHKKASESLACLHDENIHICI